MLENPEPSRPDHRVARSRAVIGWHDYDGRHLARLRTVLTRPQYFVPALADYLTSCSARRTAPSLEDFCEHARRRGHPIDFQRCDTPLDPAVAYHYRVAAFCDFAARPADPTAWHEPLRGLQLVACRRVPAAVPQPAGEAAVWRPLLATTRTSGLYMAAATLLYRRACAHRASGRFADPAAVAELITCAAAFVTLARQVERRAR